MKSASTNHPERTEFDYIIIGGGSAGCTMAARLSEQQQHSVLLLEAGPASDVNEPGSPLRDASRLVLEGYNWAHEANLQANDRLGELLSGANSSLQSQANARKSFGYRVGKVMGGSSAINGAVALRAFPSDFEDWVTLGCPSWSWDQVLPWFRRLETDMEFGHQADHGNAGPMRLRRPSTAELHPLDAAFARACQAYDIPYIDDLNSGEAPGVGLVPANVGDQAERFDVFRSYLEPALQRDNFYLLTDAEVDRIHFSGTSATGVRLFSSGETLNYYAPNIILCAGAIGSAAILQRSGVGDAQLLQALDIQPLVDLPAVGANLLDHASVVLWALPKAGVCCHGLPWRQVAARINSGYDHQVDVQIGLLNNMDSSTVPSFRNRVEYPMLVGASAMLMRPEARGQVFIQSPDPKFPVQIDLPVRESDADKSRLVGAVRKIWQLLKHPEVAQFLDGIQFWSDAMIGNDEVMHHAIKNLVNPGWHASGTVRMGAEDDPQAAALETGQVKGLGGVWVADASLFPSIPSMPTNLTTIMTAERIAHFIQEGNHS